MEIFVFKKTKQLLKVMVIMMILLLTSCSGITIDTTDGHELALEVLRCFDEKDLENLKNLFCSEVQNSQDLNSEILEAFDFYKGKSKSYNKSINVGGGKSMKDGELVLCSIVPVIRKIKTDTNEEYTIVVFSYSVNKHNSNQIGIMYINIIDSNKTNYIIGTVP